MAKRHGIAISSSGDVQLHLGIWQVFDPWIDGGLVWAQGHQGRHPEERPLYIEFHFRRVVARLAISLERLFIQLREYDRHLKEGGVYSPTPHSYWDIQEEAGMAADSVFHYFNLFVEDIARIIPYALDDESLSVDEAKSSIFNELKKRIKLKQDVPSEIANLFNSLEDPQSWWSLALLRGTGMRQRLEHSTSLLTLTTSAKPEDPNMTPDVRLVNIGRSDEAIDFEKALKQIMTNLCDWLDKLEALLLKNLVESLKSKDVSWSPFDKPVPSVYFPSLRVNNFDTNGFYLPICKEYENLSKKAG